jgi:putative transposase
MLQDEAELVGPAAIDPPNRRVGHESRNDVLGTPRHGGLDVPAAEAKFDAFIDGYNNERPHQALDMRCPAELYSPWPRPYRICFNRLKVNLSTVFAGQTFGISQSEDHLWLASFMHYCLGYFDDETGRLEPVANPLGPKVLPMSPV